MSVDAFLAFGYVPPDRTIYENVHTLPPGHYLEWDDHGLRITRYWYARFDTQQMNLDDAAVRRVSLHGRCNAKWSLTFQSGLF
jgi:asparagine synthase (glutamine-hydrolysing)